MRGEGSGIRDQGSGKAKLWLVLAAVAVAAITVVSFLLKNGGDASRPPERKDGAVSRIAEAVPSKGSSVKSERSGREGVSALSEEDGEGEGAEASENAPLTEEEKREAEEEKLVEAFDDLTDKWQEPSAKGVAMADIDNFAQSFRKVPKERRDECVHRALNLIPDENVMLLAGILMDKTMDKEIVETVFNDVLNRDEDVKKPILQEIFKDKTHPCWADTAWILDVTDELPKAK